MNIKSEIEPHLAHLHKEFPILVYNTTVDSESDFDDLPAAVISSPILGYPASYVEKLEQLILQAIQDSVLVQHGETEKSDFLVITVIS